MAAAVAADPDTDGSRRKRAAGGASPMVSEPMSIRAVAWGRDSRTAVSFSGLSEWHGRRLFGRRLRRIQVSTGALVNRACLPTWIHGSRRIALPTRPGRRAWASALPGCSSGRSTGPPFHGCPRPTKFCPAITSVRRTAPTANGCRINHHRQLVIALCFMPHPPATLKREFSVVLDTCLLHSRV